MSTHGGAIAGGFTAQKMANDGMSGKRMALLFGGIIIGVIAIAGIIVWILS